MFDSAYQEHQAHEEDYYHGNMDGGKRETEYFCVVNDEWEHEWILTDWDIWVRNPNYSGPESPHPEDVEAWDVAQWSAWEDEYYHYYESQVLFRQHLEEMTIAEYQTMTMIPLESMTPEDQMMFRTLEQACLHYGLFD